MTTARDRKRRIHALLSRWETIRFANSEKECAEDFAAMIVDLEDRLAATPAPLAVECPHCVVRHEWPCPTIPRCWVEGCGKEATCGYPCVAHRYHRSCGTHFEMAEADS